MDDSTAPAALEELARSVRRASQELDRAIAICLGESTVARWHVLTAVTGGSGVAMSQLGDATVLSGASLTRLIDAMIAENLVHRKVDDTDRRRVLVFPTRRGQVAYQSMSRAISESGLDLAAYPNLAHSLTGLIDDLHRVTAPVGTAPH
ncbi:MarR family winged helix-turn-helix transcriptional regulator [Nocardia jejuensis]|uniref:MarR family winged helix-turn-helix transcriptional regulator n=1 Tax=Nocardia jejuensis TaxID=328049 RepID=UPI000835D5A2|nr:MarR family transcriptional regulator [Nocardia jejuensis]